MRRDLTCHDSTITASSSSSSQVAPAVAVAAAATRPVQFVTQSVHGRESTAWPTFMQKNCPGQARFDYSLTPLTVTFHKLRATSPHERQKPFITNSSTTENL